MTDLPKTDFPETAKSSTSQVRWGRILAVWMLLALIPFGVQWLRGNPSGQHCELDGRKISPVQQVVVREAERTRSFCSLDCARQWLRANAASQKPVTFSIWLTDELSGELISANAAFLVRSGVENPDTGSRTHVFRSREQAERHARTFNGRLIETPSELVPKVLTL